MLSIDEYKKIYKLWEDVNPLLYDCGSMCNSTCCHITTNSKLSCQYLYMYPGEEQVHDKSDNWLTWYELDASDYDIPENWGKTITAVRCFGEKKCVREKRPIQCRTFPLEPHLTSKNKLQLINIPYKMEYKCPLISKKMILNQDFIENSYKAWKLMIQDKQIYDYVKMCSKRNLFHFKNFKVIYSPEE